MDVNEVQSEKELFLMYLTESGMVMDVNAEQP